MINNFLNWACSCLILLHYCWADAHHAKLTLTFVFENMKSKMENGIWCHIVNKNGCDLRFEICLRDARRIEQTCHLFQTTTMTYKKAKSVKYTEIIPLTEPLPERYSLKIKALTRVIFGQTLKVAEFVAEDYAIKPDGTSQSVPMKRAETKYKNADAKINVQMSINCSPNMHGERCDVYCDPLAQNYKCGSNGTRICQFGYGGSLCEIKDWCLLEPCAENKICVLLENGTGRQCKCGPKGGAGCDPCDQLPCSNGGICKPSDQSPSGFSCICTIFWTGPLCTIRRSACEVEGAVRKDSTEVDLPGNQTEPCLHGGVCEDDLIGYNFTCICPDGWQGRYCEVPDGPFPASTQLTYRVIISVSLVGILMLLMCVLIPWVLLRRRQRMKKTRSMSKRGLVYYQSGSVVGMRSSTPKCYVAMPSHRRQAASKNYQRDSSSSVYDECVVSSYVTMNPREYYDAMKMNEIDEDEKPPPLPERPTTTYRNQLSVLTNHLT